MEQPRVERVSMQEVLEMISGVGNKPVYSQEEFEDIHDVFQTAYEACCACNSLNSVLYGVAKIAGDGASRGDYILCVAASNIAASLYKTAREEPYALWHNEFLSTLSTDLDVVCRRAFGDDYKSRRKQSPSSSI